jgi:hypothetical protein
MWQLRRVLPKNGNSVANQPINQSTNQPINRVAGSHNLHAEALPLLPLLLLLLLAAGDVLLVGIDRRNHPAQVEAAYNDTSGALACKIFA